MKKEDVPPPGQKVTIQCKSINGELYIQWATIDGIPFQDGYHTAGGGWSLCNSGKLGEYPCFKINLRGYKRKRRKLWCLECIESMIIGWHGDRTF